MSTILSILSQLASPATWGVALVIAGILLLLVLSGALGRVVLHFEEISEAARTR